MRDSRVVIREARLKPIFGEFTCLCGEGSGDCKVEINDVLNAIICRAEAGCKECEMVVVIKPNLRFSAEVFRATASPGE